MYGVASSSLRAAARSAGVASSSVVHKAAKAGQKRFLNLHEHQSVELMKTYGIPTPKGKTVETAAEAEVVAAEMLHGAGGERSDVVIKAQVLAGGRGLGTFTNGFHGGVHVVTRPQQAYDIASKMLGHNLITKQTGAEGRRCDKVFLVERLYLRKEMYLSIMLDRSASGPILIASSRGGTSIEDVAHTTPELIHKEPIDMMAQGLSDQQLNRVVDALGLSGRAVESAKDTIRNLYRMFKATDATMVEVNPLAETPDGKIVVADAKINFDDNAAFRQSDIFAKRDYSQEDPREVEASKWDLNYIGLDGNIGCMVNGAGLAMATMDIIKLHGGSPANFLDVGGGATADQVTHAFEILNSDPKVQTILVNIFGGIMRCDVIAQGIVAAANKIGLRKPVVVRLQGTNVKEAKEFLAKAASGGFRIIMVDDLDQAAMTAVRVADIIRQADEVSLSVSFELPL